MSSDAGNTSASDDRGHDHGADTDERLNVMETTCKSSSSQKHGCSDLHHPELPYWHPLNGPFPTD